MCFFIYSKTYNVMVFLAITCVSKTQYYFFILNSLRKQNLTLNLIDQVLDCNYYSLKRCDRDGLTPPHNAPL